MTLVSETETETEAELEPIDYRSLVADFRAAAWCAQHVDTTDDQLLASFHKIHAYFLRAIDRNRPRLFAGIDRPFLIDIIRKWIAMYRRCIDEVRARFPRTDDSADLVTLGRNWSARLEMSYEGLARLDLASRYAEYWAERSVTWATTRDRGEGVLESYAARMAFIGSDYYVLHDELSRTQMIMLRDQAGNGIPSFDAHDAFASLTEPSALEAECKRRSWFVEYVRPDARAALWTAR
ncbi:MAG: hypothetical protein ABI867_37320 [Kofleriaceae bacterium]